MIGFYDYTVILTYISFASSISGIFLATRGHFNWANFIGKTIIMEFKLT